MNTSAMSLNLTPNKKLEELTSNVIKHTNKLAQKTIELLKTATVATAVTASALAAEGGLIWSVDHFFNDGKLTKEIFLAFNKNNDKTPNNPPTTNNPTNNNPSENKTISSDTLQHTNHGTENITLYNAMDTVLLSVLQEIVDKYKNVEYRDIQMLLGRFQGLIKENKSIDYENFQEQVNIIVDNIQKNPDENYKRNAGKIANNIIKSLNATLTADGHLLTKTVRYNEYVAETSSNTGNTGSNPNSSANTGETGANTNSGNSANTGSSSTKNFDMSQYITDNGLGAKVKELENQTTKLENENENKRKIVSKEKKETRQEKLETEALKYMQALVNNGKNKQEAITLTKNKYPGIDFEQYIK